MADTNPAAEVYAHSTFENTSLVKAIDPEATVLTATTATLTFKASRNGVALTAVPAVLRGYVYFYDPTPVAETDTTRAVPAGFRRESLTLSTTTTNMVTTAVGTGNVFTATINLTPAGTPTTLSTLVGDLTTKSVRFFLNYADGANSFDVVDDVVLTGDVNAPRTLVSNESCTACHGDFVFKGGHHGATPNGVRECVVCHTRRDSAVATKSTITSSQPKLYTPEPNFRLTRYVHGIHNSHNMPSGSFKHSVNSTEPFEVTYPTYMQNCAVCHKTPEALQAVVQAPPSYQMCMSCHQSWAGFGVANTGTAEAPKYVLGGYDHANLRDPADPTETTGKTPCVTCHNDSGTGASTKNTVSEFHNGKVNTERSGLVWDGDDVSVTEGAKVVMTIASITDDATSLTIKWGATYAGAAVNPCNTVATASAPVFFGVTADAATGRAASNLSILRGYAEGDDWTNAGVGTSPGQPSSAVNVTTTNTTCTGNEATTVIPVEKTTTATRGVVALQGKPQLFHTAANRWFQVRAKTPTREFVVGTGALPTATRRAIVDSDSCLGCHVGSLYQHGGNRVDNVDMCVICHNPASNEQNVRLNDGVVAAEAYDGKAGETYEFKSLLHAVHSAGETGAVVAIYRTNGVYLWAGEDTVIPNWPGTGPQVVYGSNNVTRTHNLHHPTYPRALNDCSACHKPGTDRMPDATKAMATTVAAGPATTAQAGTFWSNQLDDTLRGAGASACMSCHQSASSPYQNVLRAHSYQNGWVPASFPDGRQSIILQNQ